MTETPVVHIVGARPQFVKAAVVLGATDPSTPTTLVHTGQHYDPQLSQVFFDELDLPKPDYHLGIGSGAHGAQTGAMMAAIETVLAAYTPGVCVVYGDTNSTLAGAVAAAKMGWRVAHVEAGLRSFDRSMPEELNRVATDHLSEVLLCPTSRAMAQLASEGLAERTFHTGDVMLDAARRLADRARTHSAVGRFFDGGGADRPASVPSACDSGFVLATLHRAATTDDPRRLEALIEALGRLPLPTILPLHPRTRAALEKHGIEPKGTLHCVAPAGYLDFAALLGRASHVITDSGGVQKEAVFAATPCTTMRDTTEWPETLEGGWNVLVDADPVALLSAVSRPAPTLAAPVADFGDGQAGAVTATCIEEVRNR